MIGYDFLSNKLCVFYPQTLDKNHIQPQTVGDFTTLFLSLHKFLLDVKFPNIISIVLRYNLL